MAFFQKGCVQPSGIRNYFLEEQGSFVAKFMTESRVSSWVPSCVCYLQDFISFLFGLQKKRTGRIRWLSEGETHTHSQLRSHIHCPPSQHSRSGVRGK
ncbi:hypothetical protein GJAV_G00092600 [Gymnothorax javanicus]|nr:hypothetical protein GJAV_G00092600 [Gymnothorax javanicus]